MSSAITFGAIGAGTALYSASQQGKGQKSTTKTELDPRYTPYLYGDEEGTNKGLLSDAYDWYSKNKSGMNDQMLQGLNSQWSVLNDPKTMAGYQQMSNLGSGLMGTPVVGNPFADGRASLGGGAAGGGNLGIGGGQGAPGAAPPPQSYQRPAMSTAPQQGGAGPFVAPPPPPPPPPPAPAAPPAPSTWEDLFNQSKRPGLNAPAGTDWSWNGGMWQPQRYETGGA